MLQDIRLSFRGTIRQVRLGGYLPDLHSGNEPQLESDRSLSELPERVDLRAHCTPVENQGTLGSCTANAAVGALEYHRIHGGEEPLNLSRLFVYYNTRRLRGDVLNDTGAQIAECMAAVLAYGAPRESLWPYSDTDRWQVEPPQDVYREAQPASLLQYAQVNPGAGVYQAVAEGYPVCFGIFLPTVSYQSVGTDGSMDIPPEAAWQSEQMGGHAMLIVGYDLLRQVYIVRNSWGESYGDGGYLYLPFSLMERAAHPLGFWVVGPLEQLGRLSGHQASHNRVAAMRDSIRSELSGRLSDTQSLRERLFGKE